MKKLLLAALAVMLMAGAAMAQVPRSYYESFTPGETVTIDMGVRKNFAPDRVPELITIFPTPAPNGEVTFYFAADNWVSAAPPGTQGVIPQITLPNTALLIAPRSRYITITNNSVGTTYWVFVNMEY